MKKKNSIICLVLIFMSLLVGCTTQTENAVLPPARVGNAGVISASLDRSYTFEEAYQEADLVAYVKVEDWIEENEEQGITYYDAIIVEQHKGTEINEMVLLQDGTSSRTLKGYPLFTYGNEMLVFLKEAVDTEYDNAYWIIGSFTTLLDVVKDEEGNMYYMDRYGFLGETVDADLNIVNNTSLRQVLYETAISNDEIVEDMGYKYGHIYNKSDIDSLMEEYEK